MQEDNNLVKTTIKGRSETYFLVTENDLNNFKRNNILGDILFFFASILLAGFISKQDEILLLLLGLLLFGLSIYFYYVKFSTINEIKESGEIKSLNTGTEKEIVKNEKPENELTILQANYGSPAKSVDVTMKLNELVNQGRLMTIASNELAGDPHKGIVKSLNIKYKHNGLIITKEFRENEQVELP
ncbi:MAG: hypothetical protein Q8K40_01840 [Ignavibacteria bacterium]|nr:hypothetical protein [Ignavibacteria bacterium]